MFTSCKPYSYEVRVGSLFSGCGGLDLAVDAALGLEPAWFCEQADRPRQILARHWPGVPIVPDVREIDGSLGPVDVLHGGYPCQPYSAAGLKLGADDERDMWPEFFRCIRVLRPRLVIVENVAGHLVRGFERTVTDLASIGFNVRWRLLRAADVGAPHLRNRLFALAYDASGLSRKTVPDADDAGCVQQSGESTGGKEHSAAEYGGAVPADTERERRDGGQERGSEGRRLWSAGSRETVADSDLQPAGWGESELAGVKGTHRSEPDGRDQVRELKDSTYAWGVYGTAIRRWETVTGASAPRPVDDRGRLMPAFVEWMMGLPVGWTEGVARTPRLKMLGNSVVPLQASAAIRSLL